MVVIVIISVDPYLLCFFIMVNDGLDLVPRNPYVTPGRARLYKENEKRAQRGKHCALAVVRFGHRPPARCHKPTDRTDYNTLRRTE